MQCPIIIKEANNSSERKELTTGLSMLPGLGPILAPLSAEKGHKWRALIGATAGAALGARLGKVIKNRRVVKTLGSMIGAGGGNYLLYGKPMGTEYNKSIAKGEKKLEKTKNPIKRKVLEGRIKYLKTL